MARVLPAPGRGSVAVRDMLSTPGIRNLIIERHHHATRKRIFDGERLRHRAAQMADRQVGKYRHDVAIDRPHPALRMRLAGEGGLKPLMCLSGRLPKRRHLRFSSVSKRIHSIGDHGAVFSSLPARFDHVYRGISSKADVDAAAADHDLLHPGLSAAGLYVK